MPEYHIYKLSAQLEITGGLKVIYDDDTLACAAAATAHSGPGGADIWQGIRYVNRVAPIAIGLPAVVPPPLQTRARVSVNLKEANIGARVMLASTRTHLIDQKIGGILADQRRTIGLSYGDAAKKAHLTKTHLTNIESGDLRPSARELLELSKILNLQLSVIFLQVIADLRF